MELSPGVIGGLLVVSILLSIAAIAAGVMAVQGERRVKTTYSRFARGRREDVVTLLEMHMDEVKALQQEVRRQHAHARQLRNLLSRTLSRVGTVRYDAFDDMGGRLSFSIALLDEHGDGSVITAMNGRVQTRTYAKPVAGGTSSHNLSEEEVQAIAEAMDAGDRRVAEAMRSLPGPNDGGEPTAAQVAADDPTASAAPPQTPVATGSGAEGADRSAGA